LFWRPNSTARGDVRAHGLSGVREEGPQGRGAAGGGERRGDRHGAAEGDGERGRGAEEGAQGGAPDGAARRAVACPLHRGRGRRRRDASPGAAAADVPARRRGGGWQTGRRRRPSTTTTSTGTTTRACPASARPPSPAPGPPTTSATRTRKAAPSCDLCVTSLFFLAKCKKKVLTVTGERVKRLLAQVIPHDQIEWFYKMILCQILSFFFSIIKIGSSLSSDWRYGRLIRTSIRQPI
jgi:hypothetical protein